ncbi:MAG: hypothetical protein KIT84_24815 [Labilithrix sp.]|nr:hypothetical protein [Labilithrix sp.]MCW5814273.1 hypothetical protein [Labilithrix sp.]
MRAGLPGAFAYDAVARGVARAREAGVAMQDLLAGAFSASWLVNGGTPSPIFRRWLTPPLVEVWTEIAETLANESWSSLEAADRTTIGSALGALMIEGQGVGPVSKALAVLAPAAVPLMPDAALSFATAGATRVQNADAQTAGAAAFAPMMDWFSAQVAAGEKELAEVAAGSRSLLPAQVLDRALWFDSAGYMYFKGWYWLKDGDREGVAKIAAAYEGATRSNAIDLASDAVPAAFRDEALRALDG